MGSLRVWLWVFAVCTSACGARTEGEREDLTTPMLDGGLDASLFDRDSTVDRVLVRPPRIEVGCNGETLPSPRSVRTVMAPTRLSPVVLHDPTRQRALVFGGLPSSGRATREVYAVSTLDGTSRPLGSSPSELPLFTGTAWIDPPRTAIVVGGTLLGGMWTSRILRVEVEDNALRFSDVGSHPGGSCSGVTVVFDPARRAALVHGGQGIDGADPRMFSTTWQVRLEGNTTRWEVLVPASESPPSASARIAGVDPRTNAVVMTGGTTPDGIDRSVWSLSAGTRPRWTRLEGAADVVPRSGDALTWDPLSCGFLVVGGRCADQLWLLRPEQNGIHEALLGTMRTNAMTTGLGRLGAGVVFDATQRSLVVIAGTDCQTSGFTVGSNVLIGL
jgi:hypothetical protein